ncbi:hypothetical protein KIW84_024839 [Lathyrus oleraceus]|uniref:Uncharacterized protein n=1 Tax=Pisum sativum TaxID=3888 RepID=A0A9D4YMH4_PEA|nr:hypothetical protein KIW84_024837 [Pisum sativum]KAI5439203.1 hypothetical protein KIW84_024839 [Pisum sativum]
MKFQMQHFELQVASFGALHVLFHTREDLENLAAALSSRINFQDTGIYDCNGYARQPKPPVQPPAPKQAHINTCNARNGSDARATSDAIFSTI